MFTLSLAPELEQFRNEIEFACAFIRECVADEFSTKSAPVLHYGPSPVENALHVPSRIFPEAFKIYDSGIHIDREAFRRLEKYLLPPSGRWTGKPNPIEYDAIALIFVVLSRIEERNAEQCREDRYGRFPAHASLAARHFSCATPLGDIAVRDLAHLILGGQPPHWRTSYSVHLTHDVDRLRAYHKPMDPFSHLAHAFRRPLQMGRHWNTAREMWLSNEPWDSLKFIIEANERAGHPGKFFFMGPSSDSFDSPYASRFPKLLKQVTDTLITRGHQVGFHPGKGTSTNPEMFVRQKIGLEEIIGRDVRMGRQHGLLFDAAKTWNIWADSGMEEDYTLSYPAPSAFRSGTCHSHQAYSLTRRRPLPLRVYPTEIMDFGFFGGRYRDISIEEALSECESIITTCKILQGEVIVLFHTHPKSENFTTFYLELLNLL